MSYSLEFEASAVGENIDPNLWELQTEILDRVLTSDIVAGICWQSVKELLPVAPHVHSVTGIEPAANVRHRAVRDIAQAALTNVELVNGAYYDIPYPDESFDVVVGIGVPHVTSEVHRVLKPGGQVILEKIGEQDNGLLKSFFGSDEQGKRGQLTELRPNERAHMYRDEFGALFSESVVRQGFQSIWATPEELDSLLLKTSLVRNFDPVKDQANLQAFKDKHMQAGRIKLTQHRLLITATK